MNYFKKNLSTISKLGVLENHLQELYGIMQQVRELKNLNVEKYRNNIKLFEDQVDVACTMINQILDGLPETEKAANKAKGKLPVPVEQCTFCRTDLDENTYPYPCPKLEDDQKTCSECHDDCKCQDWE